MSRRLRFLSLLLVSGAVLSAQTTGALQGQVSDSKGRSIAGAKVVITGAGLQGGRTTTTDETGAFRFGLLPPGPCLLTVTKEGLNTVKAQVLVGLDKTASLNLSMAPIAAAVVEVQDLATTVDTQGTTAGMNYTSETIGVLPMARDYGTIATLAPGVTQDTTGLKIYGASGVENNWVVDGINTTNVEFGKQGKKIPMEFVKEFQVKTGGYEAEYGKATGGIINVITKSGGNEFTGDLFYYLESKGLQASNKHAGQTLGGGAFQPLPVGYRTADYGFDVGGYIVKDKLWFFVAYDRKNHSEDNQVQTGPAKGLIAPLDQTTDLFSGKLTWLLAPGHTLVASFIGDPEKDSGAVKSPMGPRPTWDGTTKIGGTDLSLRYEVVGDSWFGQLQASKHRETNTTLGGIGANQIQYINSADSSQSGGFGRWDVKDFTRDNYSGSITKMFDLGGHHELKAGFDLQKDVADASRNFSGGQLVYNNGTTGGVTNYDHYYWTTGNANDGLSSGSFVLSEWNAPAVTYSPHSQHNSQAFYIQDKYSPTSKLTINVGIRNDKTDIINNLGQTALSLKNEWAPRLGLVYDWKGKGQDKIYLSLSRFYEQLPMDLVLRSFNLERNPDVFNTDPTSLVPTPSTSASNPISNPVIHGGPEPVDRDVKGEYTDQCILGVETTLGDKYVLGAKYIRSYFGRVIEDSLDNTSPVGNYNIVNPGMSHDVGMQYPKAVRDYKGVEFSFQRKMADHYTYSVSYLWSESVGNYEGGFGGVGSVNGAGQLDPNITAAFDLLAFTVNSYGPLSGDRKHQLKANGSYEFPEWGLSIGASAFYLSGTPISAMGASDLDPYFYTGRWELFHFPRGSQGRTPDTTQLDLNLVYTKSISKLVTLRAMLDITNVLDSQTTTAVDQRFDRVNGSVLEANPTFKNPVAYQLPRSIRLGVRLSF